MLDAQITVTARKILATTPEVRKSFKDATTTRKVPTSANPAKAYVDTNTQSANQVQLCCHKVHRNLLVAKESHSLRAITPKIEGLHEVECILDSGSQIVSISEAVWRTLNRELNPRWKITMQSANGSRDESLGLIENLELEIGGMKLHVQAHVIRNPAYNVLLGRSFDVLTASHI
jgi:predicted aspartyl protease